MLARIRYFFNLISTSYFCLLNGLPINCSWKIKGRFFVKRTSLVSRLRNLCRRPGRILIGKSFCCNNKLKSNSVGVFQPCFFNVSNFESEILIGDNVGISGSTINATMQVVIGNNVLIGSGCLITDTDSHPLHWEDRLRNDNTKTKSAPIRIEDNVFIGARSIVLKGVTIGEGSVVGAGSVVSKDVPPFSVVCGNPAQIIKKI